MSTAKPPINSVSRTLKHPNGQTTHLIEDDYTGPYAQDQFTYGAEVVYALAFKLQSDWYC
jgi:hypothetical protein